MARLNLISIPNFWLSRTRESGPARGSSAKLQPRPSVLAGTLSENEFHEDGQEIAARVQSLVPKVQAETVAAPAVEARSKIQLRHVPLLLVRMMARCVTRWTRASRTAPPISAGRFSGSGRSTSGSS
ncbi:MAG TPA: hypothetical protein VH161_10730 [Candidatus Acidoferrales bacterium]|nr:hypothetical protein [Candidatus Acidoferrales bacterium]